MKYEAYIASKSWKRMRSKYEAKYPKRCYVCGGRKNICLHHKTYKRLGKEKLSDLVWLCEECHNIIHHILRQRYRGTLTLWNVAKRYKKVYHKHGREGALKWSQQWAERKGAKQKRDWSREIAKAERGLREAHAKLK